MDKDLLERATKEYYRSYGGADYYDLAIEIVDSHAIQAAIVLLATWNTGRFRYLMSSNSKNLADLIKTVNECKPMFKQLEGQNFQNAKFDEIGSVLKELYSRFSKVKGVEYTGGSKVMHLLNPRLFLIWDAAMRDHYNFDGRNAEDYLKYHNLIQQMVQNIKWDDQTKTLPRAIDEYHFITITEGRQIP